MNIMTDEHRAMIQRGVDRTTPPKRQPLADAKIWDIASDYFDADAQYDGVIAFARAIEAAHGIEETEK